MSGGFLYNTYQGIRSEPLAQYFFSAFGPAVLVPNELDFGVDLLCHYAERVRVPAKSGKKAHDYLKVKWAYGVQVKATGTPFEYTGEHALDWLKHLEFPLFFAEVDKPKGKQKIYSGWALSHFLSAQRAFGFSVDKVRFDSTIKFADIKSLNMKDGVLPLDVPILEISLADLDDQVEHYDRILKYWLEMDVNNYARKRANIPSVLGYFAHRTNIHGAIQYFRDFWYEDANLRSARDSLAELLTSYCVSAKRAKDQTRLQTIRNAFAELGLVDVLDPKWKEFVERHLGKL